MSFSWNGRFILRRIDEDDPRHHRIYKHTDQASRITNADNVFDTAPVLASRLAYDAEPIASSGSWVVTLVGTDSRVMMGVFQLRSRT